MIAEFSVVPMGSGGDSLSADVARAVQIVEDSGLPYQLTAMGTIVEGPWDEVMDTIGRAHQVLRESYPRVLTRIAVDDREGAGLRRDKKVAAVQQRLHKRES